MYRWQHLLYFRVNVEIMDSLDYVLARWSLFHMSWAYQRDTELGHPTAYPDADWWVHYNDIGVCDWLYRQPVARMGRVELYMGTESTWADIAL